jgi:hypothetical protein
LLTHKSIETSLEAAKLVTRFGQHIETMKEMVDNDMLKDNEKFKDVSEIYKDAYYSTIYYSCEIETKIKAINLLGVSNEEWFPKLDKEIFSNYQVSKGGSSNE